MQVKMLLICLLSMLATQCLIMNLHIYIHMSNCGLASMIGVLLPEYLMWMQRLQVMGLPSQPFGPDPQRHHSEMKLLHCQNRFQLQHQNLKLRSACTISAFAAD